MSRNPRRATLVATLAFVLGLLGRPAGAAELVESGEAGDLPGTAQSSPDLPFGTPLDAITGTIASDSDQDMFEIVINDPVNFSASTNNAGTNLTEDNDTILYVFDATGLAVVGVDDSAAGGPSTLPAGSLTGEPMGIYYLAVALFFTTPINAAGEIFDLGELAGSTVAVGPNGPGGTLPITGWDVAPAPSQTGPYRIELTGATFVPEPSALALQASAVAVLAGLAGRSRRRRPGRPLALPATGAPRH